MQKVLLKAQHTTPSYTRFQGRDQVKEWTCNSRDDQWGSGFINQNRIHFINDCKVEVPHNKSFLHLYQRDPSSSRKIVISRPSRGCRWFGSAERHATWLYTGCTDLLNLLDCSCKRSFAVIRLSIIFTPTDMVMLSDSSITRLFEPANWRSVGCSRQVQFMDGWRMIMSKDRI